MCFLMHGYIIIIHYKNTIIQQGLSWDAIINLKRTITNYYYDEFGYNVHDKIFIAVVASIAINMYCSFIISSI